MIAVVSQAWTLDGAAHAEAYVEAYRRFLAVHRRHPGFRGRRLLRGIEDDTHFVNVRFFDSVEAYESLTRQPGYAEAIEEMGAHLDLGRPPTKEYVEVVVADE
jgi:heme-degrading monooxygenase HmoA